MKIDQIDEQFISSLESQYKLSHQDRKFLAEAARDLQIWGESPLSRFWKEEAGGKLKGKQRKQALIVSLKNSLEELRSCKDYSGFTGRGEKDQTIRYVLSHDEDTILGSCPVASEKTRCCNLMTLDAVNNCGFDCTYCSIQSFFDGGRVYFHKNLEQKLSSITLDKNKRYHIGTGQSSDSLMWGNREGLLDKLMDFASAHPNVMLELKTKSKNISWLTSHPVPSNIVATWSLNTQTIISNEEHLTASLDERIASARAVADKGIKVGFHFHPMVIYEGWEEDYGLLFKRICEDFKPEEVMMISFGTLTFIKPVIKKIRKRDFISKILQMPLTDASGKLSYPVKQKEELFRFAASSFPSEWKKEVFFYLCMEDKELWEPVFGRHYETNEEFEKDMIDSYFRKISL